MKTIKTWLPIFPGFYNTIFEPQEDSEMDYVNSERRAKGLSELDFDAFDFDYTQYNQDASKGCVNVIERELKEFVKAIEFEALRSPREYNFRNDSIDIEVTLTKKNEKTILDYLQTHSEKFTQYLKDRYTSCSGFISSYPNTIEDFMTDKPLEHSHKLGSILEFICRNEDVNEETLYYGIEANLTCTNYHELINRPDKDENGNEVDIETIDPNQLSLQL